jgi:dihydroxy-acid dehydratase
VINQMEGQSYHAAFVVQGCDKTPLGIVSGLAHLDCVRRDRGEVPVWATFAPAHVLRGGSIPADTAEEIREVARRCEAAGHDELALDIRDNLGYILQCASNEAFQALFERVVQEGVMSPEQHASLEKRLAVNACHEAGGICAFHGTGNSSRDVVAAFGLVHPAVELLTEPPTQAQVNAAVDGLFSVFNRPEYSVGEMVKGNIANVVRVHSAVGGSSNLMMHVVAAMVYAGHDFTLWDMERTLKAAPVPDIYDYSLTQGRDVFALAQQCCAGLIRGTETVIYELMRNGVPMDIDAPTVTGTTWRERLADTSNLSAEGVKDNPIILSKPRRAISGVDVLRANWFESAVVKISGLPDDLLNKFDDKVAVVLYFETEEAANEALVDVDLLSKLRHAAGMTPEMLRRMDSYNGAQRGAELQSPDEELYDRMVRTHTLRIAMVIGGQGPEAFGMPEMCVPSFRINYNRVLRQLVSLITDGRYSGTNFGASVGHVAPEAARGGGVAYLRTGDLMHLRFRAGRLDLLDREAFIREGVPVPYSGDLADDRAEVGAERIERLNMRAFKIAPANRMLYHTDAAHGVVPGVVADWARSKAKRAAITDRKRTVEELEATAVPGVRHGGIDA